MAAQREKIVGIIGGMGPEATVDLMQRIIRLTPALDDGDHIRCIVDNNPKVPSRIKAIIEGGTDNPGPCMADMGKKLEAFGADFLVIACNTAHYYHNTVQKAVNIPVINMIELVSHYVKTNFPEQNKIGILASPAVAITKLYNKRLKKLGMKDIWPDTDHQDSLLKVIKEIKKGNTSSAICDAYAKVCRNLSTKGIKTAIVACTELSVLNTTLPINTIDAAQVLALEIVQIIKNSKNMHYYNKQNRQEHR
jgi:aspartate racemase